MALDTHFPLCIEYKCLQEAHRLHIKQCTAVATNIVISCETQKLALSFLAAVMLTEEKNRQLKALSIR